MMDCRVFPKFQTIKIPKGAGWPLVVIKVLLKPSFPPLSPDVGACVQNCMFVCMRVCVCCMRVCVCVCCVWPIFVSYLGGIFVGKKEMMSLHCNVRLWFMIKCYVVKINAVNICLPCFCRRLSALDFLRTSITSISINMIITVV